MGTPNQRLDQALYDLGFARRIADNRLTNLRLAGDPLNGTDYDRTGGHGGISDPTPTQAHNLGYWHHLEEAVLAELDTVTRSAAHLLQLLQRCPSGVDTKAETRRIRCTGGEPSSEPWVRSECEENAVTRDGLCSACYQRRHHYRTNQETEVA